MKRWVAIISFRDPLEMVGTAQVQGWMEMVVDCTVEGQQLVF